MHTARALHVHYTHTTHTLPQKYTHTTRSPHTPYTYTSTTVHAHRTHTTRTLHAHYMHTTRTLHAHYTHTAYTLHPRYTIPAITVKGCNYSSNAPLTWKQASDRAGVSPYGGCLYYPVGLHYFGPREPVDENSTCSVNFRNIEKSGACLQVYFSMKNIRLLVIALLKNQ